VEPGWAYFANSYRINHVPDGWVGATTEYGGGFVSALEREDVLACQFHPELSGAWGARLLGRWLETAKEAA
jgi:imidazoleglycerol phosphate synthase glutamine amidotransferase subunit HisH